MQAKRLERLAVLALLGSTAAWGSTFVVVKDGIEQMSLWSLNSWRWMLAFVLLAAIRPRALRVPRELMLRGVAVGAVTSLGYLFQTVGLLTTTASVSGFITGMFVVFTPFFARIFIGDRITGSAWIGVLLSFVGLGLISLNGFSLSVGVLWTLAGAAMWAMQIVTLAKWATRENAYSIAVIQIGVVAVFFTIGALIEGPEVPPNAGVWQGLFVLIVFASVLAYTVQVWGQAHIDATRAAVIFTMEPVFAGIFGVWLRHDPLTLRTLAGAAFILCATLVSEFGSRRARVVANLAQPHIAS
jgi:drug/metabolite transporter (DMT)-like permease